MAAKKKVAEPAAPEKTTKAAKAAASAKPAEKAAASANGNGTTNFRDTSRSEFLLGDKITVIQKENPKRPGSAAAERYDLYKSCKTVRDYLEAGGSRGDLKWDRDRNWISVGA